ncbi:MAG TPA: hypothetical protein VIY90_02870 [Steroidobacteraceae bacterium]
MNKFSVILTGMFAVATSIALATTPGTGSSGGGGGYSGAGASSGGGGSSTGGGSHGGGGGGGHGGGGGGHGGGGGGGAHGGSFGGGGGGHGYGGGTHSSAAAAGWAHGSSAHGSRGISSGAPSASYRAVQLRSHAAARAIAVANHKPHPGGPIGRPRPGHPRQHQPYEQVFNSIVGCAGNVDCALWGRGDLYCVDYPSDYPSNANDGTWSCPHSQRLEIDPRTGLPRR